MNVMMADGFGWNPSTIEAWSTFAAACFAVVAAGLALCSWMESRNQGRVLRAEVRDRMRPWVGLFGFEFLRDHEELPYLSLKLRNFGPLPAREAHLTLAIEPRQKRDGEQANPIRYEEPNLKVLVPEEDGNYRIPLKDYSQLTKWIADKRDLLAIGTFEYALDDRKFESQFEARLRFSEPTPPSALVATNWRNTSAT